MLSQMLKNFEKRMNSVFMATKNSNIFCRTKHARSRSSIHPLWNHASVCGCDVTNTQDSAQNWPRETSTTKQAEEEKKKESMKWAMETLMENLNGSPINPTSTSNCFILVVLFGMIFYVFGFILAN